MKTIEPIETITSLLAKSRSNGDGTSVVDTATLDRIAANWGMDRIELQHGCQVCSEPAVPQ